MDIAVPLLVSPQPLGLRYINHSYIHIKSWGTNIQWNVCCTGFSFEHPAVHSHHIINIFGALSTLVALYISKKVKLVVEINFSYHLLRFVLISHLQ